jgi:predicted PurR-regulated permease PerM
MTSETPKAPPRPFSKPAFGSWALLLCLSLALYFQFASALLVALTLAVVCRPVYEKLYRLLTRFQVLKSRGAMARGLSSFITQILGAFFVLVCVLAPLWVLSRNRNVILEAAEGASAGAREWSRAKIQALGVRLDIPEWTAFAQLPVRGEAEAPAGVGILHEEPVQATVVDMLSHPAPFLPSALRTLGGWASGLGQLMFLFMALHFMLLHGPDFWQGILESSPEAWRPTFAHLAVRGRTVLVATCMVHGLTALSAFFLALPVFWLVLGAKHCLLMAMLAGFFQFIPLLGSATLLCLITVYFFATGLLREGWICLMVGFPLLVGLPDLLVRPYLAQRFGRVHSMTMLAGFITGIEVFGPLGFVLGPLLLDLIVQFTGQVLRGYGRRQGDARL